MTNTDLIVAKGADLSAGEQKDRVVAAGRNTGGDTWQLNLHWSAPCHDVTHS